MPTQNEGPIVINIRGKLAIDQRPVLRPVLGQTDVLDRQPYVQPQVMSQLTVVTLIDGYTFMINMLQP